MSKQSALLSHHLSFLKPIRDYQPLFSSAAFRLIKLSQTSISNYCIRKRISSQLEALFYILKFLIILRVPRKTMNFDNRTERSKFNCAIYIKALACLMHFVIVVEGEKLLEKELLRCRQNNKQNSLQFIYQVTYLTYSKFFWSPALLFLLLQLC